MRFRERPRRRVLINITSLIDVLFLLLIFFMVSSTFLEQPGMKLDLPAAKSFEVEEHKELVVHISPQGEIFLGEQQVALDTLKARLELQVAVDRERPLVLRADKDAAHGRVVEVMDVAKQTGVRKIVIATRVPELNRERERR
ncbi:MAG: biopolymer transporter ExbD [bacterium]|nr:biopolymer transporter ExbD [candidate division KSB1 bacterium]MDH7560344.1 biopolymer transporter ExbD [bacterium]